MILARKEGRDTGLEQKVELGYVDSVDQHSSSSEDSINTSIPSYTLIKVQILQVI